MTADDTPSSAGASPQPEGAAITAAAESPGLRRALCGYCLPHPIGWESRWVTSTVVV